MKIARLRSDVPVPRLRIVGDIAVRSCNGAHMAAIASLNATTGCLPTVANFEGPVVEQDPEDIKQGLWSNAEPLCRIAGELALLAGSLANNHIHDLGGDLQPTLSWVSDQPIGLFGLNGKTVAPALSIEDPDDRRWVLVGCGWSGSGCRRSVRSHDWRMLSPLNREFDALLVSLRRRWPEAMLIVMPHWDYEFAVHPHPAFRQCARRWASLGVNCVVGSHPHVVGGFESFGSTPVAYSVGNAVLDRRQYFGGTLRTRPEEERLGAVVLDHSTGRAELFSTLLNGQGIRLAGPSIDDWNNYRNAIPGSYEAWYRANRRQQQRGLPVFGERDGPRAVAAKETLVRQRAWAVSHAHRLLRQR